MTNTELDQTGAEYEEQLNSLQEEHLDSSEVDPEIDMHDVMMEDGNHMYPDDVDQDEYPDW